MLKNTWIRSTAKSIKLYSFKRSWRKTHTDTDTIPMCKFNSGLVSVGTGTYGELNITTFSDKSKLLIGNYVSIAQNVSFLLDVEHYTNHVSTYPYKVKILKTKTSESFSKGDILIDDDVWIGYGATIFQEFTLGKAQL